MNRLSGPFLIVHNISHMRDAVAITQKLGRPVTLISAPGAAASIGPEVFAQMLNTVLGNEHTEGIQAVIDCGADPGQALKALRFGCRHIRLDADDDVLAKFRDMTEGDVLDATPLPAYDMNDGTQHLCEWLQAEPAK